MWQNSFYLLGKAWRDSSSKRQLTLHPTKRVCWVTVREENRKFKTVWDLDRICVLIQYCWTATFLFQKNPCCNKVQLDNERTSTELKFANWENSDWVFCPFFSVKRAQLIGKWREREREDNLIKRTRWKADNLESLGDLDCGPRLRSFILWIEKRRDRERSCFKRPAIPLLDPDNIK